MTGTKGGSHSGPHKTRNTKDRGPNHQDPGTQTIRHHQTSGGTSPKETTSGGMIEETKGDNGDKREGCRFQARRSPQPPEERGAKLNGPESPSSPRPHRPRAMEVAGDPLPPKWCKQSKTRRPLAVHQTRGKGTANPEQTLVRARARARAMEVERVVEEAPVAVSRGMEKEMERGKVKAP